MVSNTILYIALMSTGRLNVALTKDLLLTVRKLKSRSGSVEGIVFLEEFDSLRAAAARLVELRSLAPTELWTLVKDVNPQLSDLSGEFVPVAATFDSLSWLIDDWSDEGDEGGGVLARLRRGPTGPIRSKTASHAEGLPELWAREQEYRAVFGG